MSEPTGRPLAVIGILAAAALAVGTLGGVAAIRTSVAPYGRVIMVPVADLSPAADGPSIAIDECVAGAGGLEVRGHVQPGSGAGSTSQVVVAVTGSASGLEAGRSVGLGFASSTELGEEVGSFRLQLPWASAESEFGVLRAQAPTGAPALTGAVARCPQVTR